MTFVPEEKTEFLNFSFDHLAINGSKFIDYHSIWTIALLCQIFLKVPRDNKVRLTICKLSLRAPKLQGLMKMSMIDVVAAQSLKEYPDIKIEVQESQLEASITKIILTHDDPEIAKVLTVMIDTKHPLLDLRIEKSE